VKRIFSRRAFMSFLMNVIRLTILTVVFGLILLSGWQALILAPVCGIGCALETLQGVILPMVIGAVAVMAFMAIFDYLVQRAEFLREQMMSITEFKREMKDALGDPHLRGQLKQERKSMLTTNTGPGNATIMVSAGNSLSIGVRYISGETPAPLIVAKARGTKAIRSMAQKSGAREFDDRGLVADIENIAVGGYITDDETIAKIAPLLQGA
jgi:type III secretion protein U